VIPRWLQKAWRAFAESYDRDELVAASSPASIALGASALAGVLLLLAFVPAFAARSQLQNVGWSCALVGGGACLTLLAWSRGCRGTLGTLGTLFDSAFYSAALALAALSSNEHVGVALAVVHGLMVTSFQGRLYSLTALVVVVIALPVVVLIVAMRANLPVAIILMCSLLLMALFMQVTGTKRTAQLRQKRLEQALDAADRLADESVQTALTVTLLTLGHFLHELRNYQTAIAVNLEFIAMQPDLASGSRTALNEAQQAQKEQTQLVRETIESLRGRAKQETGTFHVAETLRAIASERRTCDVRVSAPGEFELKGNPEHLRVIMLNLLRNAEQAGAAHVECFLRIEPSGTAVSLTINDDGAGIPDSQRAALFESLTNSTKPGGSGLGLYLVRRHTELLGGKIAVGESTLGGAAFVLTLPGQAIGLVH